MSDAIADVRGVPFLAQLGEEVCRSLAAASFVRRLARDQVLFVEGEPADHLFIVISGRLRVLISGPRGDELVLALAGPGTSIGDITLIDGGPRSATVDAAETAELRVLPIEEVRAHVTAHPQALLWLAQGLAADLRRLSGTSADLVHLDLPRRLAKLLLSEAQTAPDGTMSVELGMSQAGVAARLGVTRQSLNRAVMRLTDRSWIRTEGAHVVITDLAALTRYAAG
jgi:CRP-like cAMP-binding protein